MNPGSKTIGVKKVTLSTFYYACPTMLLVGFNPWIEWYLYEGGSENILGGCLLRVI